MDPQRKTIMEFGMIEAAIMIQVLIMMITVLVRKNQKGNSLDSTFLGSLTNPLSADRVLFRCLEIFTGPSGGAYSRRY